MLKNWRLVNVPEGGVRLSLPNVGTFDVTEETLTDAVVEAFVAAGQKKYFEPKSLKNGKAKITPIDQPDGNDGTGNDGDI